MNDPLASRPPSVLRYRWGVPALIAVGAALWIATGRWQWPLLACSLLCAAAFASSLVHDGRAAASVLGRRGVRSSRGERLSETVGVWVLLGGLDAWAWAGEWRFAVAGGTVWAATALGARIRAGRRHSRWVEETAELAERAERLMEQGRFDQGSAVYERLFVGSGIGDSRARDLVASALFSRAVELERQSRPETAAEAYTALLNRYGLVSTATAAELIAQAGRRLRELGR